jgi:protein gp37
MSSTSTGIEWTDATWNPMTGCSKISPGCDHCYADVLAQGKMRDRYLLTSPMKDTEANRADPFAPRYWERRLHQPLSWREPRRVFVNSMSDVFHAQFPLELLQRIFDVMVRAAQHQFQVLTKRPERALRFADTLPWPSNVWLGTSIETIDYARRVDALRQVPAAVRFISAEPLLGPLDTLDLTGIHWVIGGGESGAAFRKVDASWARSLRDLCVRERVAFFWKQWGGRTPKAGGRELDGREWSQYPATAAVHRAGNTKRPGRASLPLDFTANPR